MAKRSSSPRLAFALKLMARSAFKSMQGTQHIPIKANGEEAGITFIGHSSFLIQIGGLNILVDPVFATWLIILRRLRRPGVAMKDLPPIDAVLLSHAHMDHLNLPSLRRIIRHTRKLTGKPPAVIVPWNVADLVSDLGFSRVESLEWWQSTTLPAPNGDVDVTLTPAKHWGARKMTDSHRGFGGYALRNHAHSIYHSGDTAYFNGFHEIGRRMQPQVALLPIGAYSPDSFRSVHTSPEDALQIFLDLDAQKMIPMHYGTFCLSMEPMDEPLPRLLAAAAKAGVSEKMLPLTEGGTKILSAPSTDIVSTKSDDLATV